MYRSYEEEKAFAKRARLRRGWLIAAHHKDCKVCVCPVNKEDPTSSSVCCECTANLTVGREKASHVTCLVTVEEDAMTGANRPHRSTKKNGTTALKCKKHSRMMMK